MREIAGTRLSFDFPDSFQASDSCLAEGRNGLLKAHGVIICPYYGEHSRIDIHNRTSRGTKARGHIVLPIDRDVIDSVIGALEQIKGEL